MRKAIGLIALVFLGLHGFCQKKAQDPEKTDSATRGLTLVLNEEQMNSLSILLQVGKAYITETDISMKAGIRVMNFGDSLIRSINARIARRPTPAPDKGNKPQGTTP